MWRISVCFVGHRLLLLLTIFLIIKAKVPASPPLWPTLAGKVAALPEYAGAARAQMVSWEQWLISISDPFLWVSGMLAKLGLSPAWAIILVSNLFTCFFLFELYALLVRMVTPEIAYGAALLGILWPTGYEMSLGSSASLAAFLGVAALRHALDNHWLYAGLALGALMLMDVGATALFPLILYIFWYFQRHFQWQQVLKRVACLAVPTLFAWWKASWSVSQIRYSWKQGALSTLLSSLGNGSLGWTLSAQQLGQTITWIILSIGGVIACVSNSMLMHRLVPLSSLLVLMGFSSYGDLGSKAMLAGPALQGIASHSSRQMMGFIQVTMFLLTVYELYLVFR